MKLFIISSIFLALFFCQIEAQDQKSEPQQLIVVDSYATHNSLPKQLPSTLAPMQVIDSDLMHAPLLRLAANAAKQPILARGDGTRRRQRGGRRGRGRRNRSPAQHYYKPLLKALKREDRRELKQIVRANITKAEIKEKVEKWVQNEEDPKTKEAFQLFQQERELMKKLKLIGDENFLDGKSSEAKQLYNQLKQLRDNQSLTWDQTCTKRNELLIKSNVDALEELRRKAKPCFRNDSWDRLTGGSSFSANQKPKNDD